MLINQFKRTMTPLSRSNTTKRFKGKKRINREHLPSPLVFYKQLGLNLKGKNEWRMAQCPFHDDKHASLSINTIHGGFFCHACGAKGDQIGFYMRLKQVDFKTACNELGL